MRNKGINGMKKTVSLMILALLFSLAAFSLQGKAETETTADKETEDVEAEEKVAEIIADGVCGENLVWELTDEGLLTIHGSGPMTDFASAADVPWSGYRDMVKELDIEDGATSVGKRAFMLCTGLQQVILPESVKHIGDYAFQNCNLEKIIAVGAVSAGYLAFQFADNGKTPLMVVFSRALQKLDEKSFYNYKWNLYPVTLYFYGTEEEWALIHCRMKEEIKVQCVSEPVLVTNPENQKAGVGNYADFQVAAEGASLLYQWQYSKDEGESWGIWRKAVREHVQVMSYNIRDGYLFRCQITDVAGITIYSEAASLQVLKTGLYEQADGRYHLYEEGVEKTNFTGFYTSPLNQNTFYIMDGIWVSGATALFRWEKEEGVQWAYVKGGIWQENYSGFYRSDKGRMFYISKGIWASDKTAVMKDKETEEWLYIEDGVPAKDYTGIFWGQNGTGYYIVRGKWRYRDSGMKIIQGRIYTIRQGRVVVNGE